MRAVVLGACLLSVIGALTSTTTASASGDVFAVLQNFIGDGSVVVYNATGGVKATSPLHWDFRWPVAEATVNTLKKQISLITFPNPTALFTLDFGLGAPVNTQVSTNLSYFNLQFCPNQNTYYGIVVSSAYGRVISKFSDFNEPVVHTPIQALPYMWYVNASTFDYQNSRYYSLINNFPGFPNSTSEQQLAIGHFAESTPRVEIVKMVLPGTDILIRFIAFSNAANRLFGLANLADGSTAILEMDPYLGQYTIRATFPNTIAQPMYAAVKTPTLHFFVLNTATNHRDFIHVVIGTWTSRVDHSVANDWEHVIAVAGLE